jgi:hypothetical protein
VCRQPELRDTRPRHRVHSTRRKDIRVCGGQDNLYPALDTGVRNLLWVMFTWPWMQSIPRGKGTRGPTAVNVAQPDAAWGIAARLRRNTVQRRDGAVGGSRLHHQRNQCMGRTVPSHLFVLRVKPTTVPYFVSAQNCTRWVSVARPRSTSQLPSTKATGLTFEWFPSNRLGPQVINLR